MNQLYLIFLLVFSIRLSAQDKSVLLNGKIESDSMDVGNVHILNINSKKGAISNADGTFRIKVSLNDTLSFSAIQFYFFQIVITNKILKSKYVEIDLIQKINTLNEIVIKSHDLQGNLTIDSKNFMDTIKQVNPMLMNFRDMDLKPPSLSVAKQLDSDRMPDVTDPFVPVGGDILGLAYFLFEPVINEIKKSRKTKKELKIKDRAYQKALKDAPENIRIEFGDDFFMNKLKIPKERIDEFILFCKPKGILELFVKNKKIEMIDVFLIESKKFIGK